MKPVTQELLRQAIDAFAFELPAGEAERFGAGHINDTFAVWSADRSRRWIVQRINTDTFTDPAGLMENITGVTAYLRRQIEARGGDAGRETLNVIPTRDGRAYYTDPDGGEQLPGRSHYGDGLDGDDAPRGAGLRLRRRAGADHDRRGVAARRSAAGVRPEQVRRLRVHRLPVSPRQVSGSVGFWREVRFLLFSGSGTISTRGIRNFARPLSGGNFFAVKSPEKGQKTACSLKNIARACDFPRQSCPDRKKLLFLFVIWRVVPRGGRRSDADPRAQSVL